MDINSNLIIKCPHCGCEYLPNEIFYPDELLGNASNVVRDENGKIIFHEGNNMNLKEEYVCDWCNKSFTAELKVNIVTTKPDVDFDDDFADDIE